MIPHEFNGRIYYICEKCGTNTGLRAVVNCSVCAGRNAELARKRARDIGRDCPHTLDGDAFTDYAGGAA